MNHASDTILALVSLADRIEGRTKFQKMVYILQCKGVPFPEKFKYHYYGPYSVDLQFEIDDLVFRECLNEDEQPIADSVSTYVYSVKEKKESAELQACKALIDLLNRASRAVLELTSTIFFLRRQEQITDKTVIIKKLKFLKPHLAEHIEEAFALEEQIDRC